jgi:hypothetical protein
MLELGSWEDRERSSSARLSSSTTNIQTFRFQKWSKQEVVGSGDELTSNLQSTYDKNDVLYDYIDYK